MAWGSGMFGQSGQGIQNPTSPQQPGGGVWSNRLTQQPQQSPMGARHLPFEQNQPPMGQPQGGAQGGNAPRGIPPGAGGRQRFGQRPGNSGNQPYRGIPFGGGQISMPGPMGYSGNSMMPQWGNDQMPIAGMGGFGKPGTGRFAPIPDPSKFRDPSGGSIFGNRNPNIGNGTGSNSRTSTDWLKRHPEEAGGGIFNPRNNPGGTQLDPNTNPMNRAPSNPRFQNFR